MRSIVFIALIFLALTLAAQQNVKTNSVLSPDGKITMTFQLADDGTPQYLITRNGQPVIQLSRLGFVLKDLPSLDKDFQIVGSTSGRFDETWAQPWGESKFVRNHYNSLLINLQEKTGAKRLLGLEFRAFNDGIGFRYEFADQSTLKEFIVMDELTEFNLAEDLSAWWIPAYGEEMDSEYLYKNTKASAIDLKTTTPITLEREGLTVCLHEAALVDYAGMAIERKAGLNFKCDLVPWSNGNRAEVKAPFKTPWRTIQITSSASELASSAMILNLNAPNKLGDVSWIKPAKYNGIWWGMHLTRNTWEAGPKHGATTQNVKELIDFASAHNLQGVLAEGWNEGWEGDWTADGNFSFTKPYPDYDLDELSRYAREKNISLISHHETGGNVANYEKQLDDAFRQLQKYDIHYLKTGYVNKLPSGERHQGQFMVRHYHKVMETAAKYKVMLDVHEPVKDTGLRRTYPNMMTREGARGNEYEAWSAGNPPSHTTILPFTRLIAGPLDYTPGIFDILFENKGNFRVHTTLAKQLALYVVIYSPLHMAADLPSNYEGNPAFKFIEQVPTDWSESRFIHASIGNYVTVARKNRNGSDWYVGSITDEEPRTLTLPLDFLDKGKTYRAEVFADGERADYSTNPLPVSIKQSEVTNKSTLSLTLAAGGGAAIRLTEISNK